MGFTVDENKQVMGNLFQHPHSRLKKTALYVKC